MRVRSMGGTTTVMAKTETFLEWLTRKQKERGVSWRTLAKQSGVSHGALDNYRRNPSVIPELQTLLKLADWAGETLEDVQRRVNIQPSSAPRVPSVFRQRADRLIGVNPPLGPYLNTLLNTPGLDPDTLSSVLDHFEKREGLT